MGGEKKKERKRKKNEVDFAWLSPARLIQPTILPSQGRGEVRNADRVSIKQISRVGR